jgi:glycosyltransferase involved in cell wall biosynthesis
MKKDSLSVSIVIPTLWRLDILEKSIGAVVKMDIQPIEILVICRPKDDTETYEWLVNISKEIETLKIVTIDIPGQVQAMNAAIPLAKGDIVAILDDDALPKCNWLSEIIKCYKDPKVGAVGGRDVVHAHDKVYDTPQVQVAGVRNFWGTIVGNHHLVVGKAREVDVIKGCNLTFRRSAVGKLRFDERLLGKGAQVGNDSWFSLCVKQLGYKVILNPQAIVDHFPAERADGARGSLSKEKCFEHTVNNIAIAVSFLDLWKKLKFISFYIVVGSRFCPGVLQFLNALLERPKKLPEIMISGWSGFFAGLKLAKEFEKNLPGEPKLVK